MLDPGLIISEERFVAVQVGTLKKLGAHEPDKAFKFFYHHSMKLWEEMLCPALKIESRK